ncbi:hypothetical protein JOM56_013408 [Amanita muscaria]
MSSNMDAQSYPHSIPEGYAVVTHNGNQYLVPKFMLPATQQSLDANQKRLASDLDKAQGGAVPIALVPVPNFKVPSTNTQELPYELMGADKVVIPSDPPLTPREVLGLHTEVKALQERLGISYKDASHHLYMAEIQNLKADEQIHKISAIMKGRTQKALELFKIHGSNTDAEAEADTDAKKSGI